MTITELCTDFVAKLTVQIEAGVKARILQALTPPAAPSWPGPRWWRAPAPKLSSRPKQLCPVPGCKGLAAPVFGMVCSKQRAQGQDRKVPRTAARQ